MEVIYIGNSVPREMIHIAIKENVDVTEGKIIFERSRGWRILSFARLQFYSGNG
jgi:hypothetical protein